MSLPKLSDTENLLSETQAAEMAGVSIETLRQYGKFGLLEIVAKGSENFVRENDIVSLFHVKALKKESFGSVNEEELNKSNLRVLREKVISRTAPPAQPASSTTEGSGIEQKAGPNFTIVADKPEAPSEGENPSAPHNNTVESINSSSYGTAPSVEVISINQTLREQIELLKEERNWLRERLEQLENRTQRDQMLLLSESETIRNLVLQNRPKRFFGLTLPWFGKE